MSQNDSRQLIRVSKYIMKGSNEDLLVVFSCAQSVFVLFSADMLPRRLSEN